MKRKSTIVAGWALMAWLVLCMLAATATAQDFQYKTNNDALTITAYFGAGGNVVVPGAIGGLPVGSIGSYGFSFSTNVTGVTLPNSITNIGESAFYRCSALTNVTIGAGAITFESLAFAGCTKLNRITVDPLSSVYSSVDGVLFNKSRTTLIQYPTGKTGSYTIPNTVTTIGNSAFASCTGVTNIVIPNNVTGFGESAFSDCTNLTSVIMGDFITNIWYSAFYGCSRLTIITISPSVQSIRSGGSTQLIL